MIELLELAVTSPWVYLALFAIAVIDGFFPVVPSETMVITAGGFAAGGEPNLAAVIAVAALGAVGYPLRRFTAFDALAAGSWALYSALVGYLGGAAFEHDKLKGLMFGLGLAFGVTVLVEAVRFVRGRLQQTRLIRDDRRLHPVPDTEPGQDGADVALHSSLHDVEPPRDLHVR